MEDMSIKCSEIKAKEYTANGKTLTFIKPLVMGIVNLTPDSFYDGGKFSGTSDVLRDVEEKVKQGADIIDLGAASTRPGAQLIDTEEEWKRLGPVLTEVRKEFPSIFISIDTYHSVTAGRSAELGADIINDVSGGNYDPLMFETISSLQLPYILMHLKGTPDTMQDDPRYDDLVEEVHSELMNGVHALQEMGFNKVILDPGFGFGKTLAHNFSLLKHVQLICNEGLPVMAGISRKSMINKVIGTNPVTALNGTTVLNTMALMNGCRILRVHDVAEARQAVELFDYYQKSE